jgi:MarR family transcriptional regulator for hemolysin
MLQYDFDESIGCWIALTNQALRRAVAARLADEEITLRQWEVLACLALKGEDVSQVELADMLGIEAPTLVGVLTRMERDDWLTRESCTQDRRRKLIRPTSKAQAVWGRMVDCCHEVREQATQGISRQELVLFQNVCERIRENLGETSANPFGSTSLTGS